MKQAFETRFFLGANSPTGFYSLYDDFTDTNDTLNIIKGGPGCGKSTFMKTIAAGVHSAGYSVEYIHCSGDPDSLDGVYFPELHVGYVDGTSPHVIEPKYTGACENYVNIGEFYDADALRDNKDSIIKLTNAYKAYYARAYKLIAAAAAVYDGTGAPLSEDTLLTAARRAKGIICREIKPSGRDEGKTTSRFLGAVTCKGAMCFYDTAEALADRIYVLDNDLGLGSIIIEMIADAAESKGWDTVRCQSPLRPDVTEHLIIPELELAFVTSASKLPYNGKAYRHLRLDTIPKRSELAGIKSDMRNALRLHDELIDEAIGALSKAKSLHDRLEEVYNPHVSFNKVTELAEKHIDKLIG